MFDASILILQFVINGNGIDCNVGRDQHNHLRHKKKKNASLSASRIPDAPSPSILNSTAQNPLVASIPLAGNWRPVPVQWISLTVSQEEQVKEGVNSRNANEKVNLQQKLLHSKKNI
jgi:hypothetical protein